MNWLAKLLGGKNTNNHTPSTTAEDRALSATESEFIGWMLNHGNDRSRQFLAQVDKARVVGRCTCGCASINLAIDGVTHYPQAGMETLCAFRWKAVEGEFEVFAFACDGLLAGIDLWAVWGQHPASYLPATSLLAPAPSDNPQEASGG